MITDLCFFIFLIFSEWFIIPSSKISHVDDAGMTGIFTVLISLFALCVSGRFQ